MAMWVDDVQEVRECDETDNVAFGRDLVRFSFDLPDIAVESWWAQWGGSTGTGELHYRVTNLGTSTIGETDWDINLFLHTLLNPADPQGRGYYLFYEDATHTLAPGGAIYRDSSNPASFNVFRSQFGTPVATCVDTVSTQPRALAPLPDVSVRKCVDDGFALVAIHNASGAPERYVCVDRQSGRKCESWAYYRGECVLGTGWNTMPGSSPALRKSAIGYVSNCGSNEPSGETKQYNRSVTGSGCPSALPSHGSATGSPGLESDNAGE